MIDQRTGNLSLPLPHPENWLEEDLPRLRESINLLDSHLSILDFLTGLTDGFEASAQLTLEIKSEIKSEINQSLESGYQTGMSS